MYGLRLSRFFNYLDTPGPDELGLARVYCILVFKMKQH